MDEITFRNKALEILTPLDGKFRVSAREPETFTDLVQTIGAIRRSLSGLIKEFRPRRSVLTELGRLVAALVKIESAALTLRSWLGREVDDGAFGMSSMAGEQYREAVADYLGQLCTFKECFESLEA